MLHLRTACELSDSTALKAEAARASNVLITGLFAVIAGAAYIQATGQQLLRSRNTVPLVSAQGSAFRFPSRVATASCRQTATNYEVANLTYDSSVLTRANDKTLVLGRGGADRRRPGSRQPRAIAQSAWQGRALQRMPNRSFLSPTGSRVHLLTSWITENDLFYVRSHFYTPAIQLSAWSMRVDGDVQRPIEVTLNELKQMPSTTHVVTLEGAGN